MKIYLMRHGHAASPGSGKPSVLTPQGDKDAAKVGHWLRKNIQPPQALWYSPLPRASQTAGIIQKLLALPPETLLERAELVPEGNASGIYREIHKKTGDLMLVSHMPFLKSLLAHFFDPGEHPEALDFPTAGVCALETGKGKTKWLWALHPSDL